MSFGVFEAGDASQSEQDRQIREASNKLAAATYDVQERFGSFLFGARDLEEYHDRLALCKNDIIKTIEPHVFPRTGVIRRVLKPIERHFKTATMQRTAMRRTADDDKKKNPNPGHVPGLAPPSGGAPGPGLNPLHWGDEGGGHLPEGFDPATQAMSRYGPIMRPGAGGPPAAPPPPPGHGPLPEGMTPFGPRPGTPAEQAVGNATIPNNPGGNPVHQQSGPTGPGGPGPGAPPGRPGGPGGGPTGWTPRDIPPGSIKPGTDYQIQYGDTLSNIAQAAGIKDYNDIAKANTEGGDGFAKITNPDVINTGEKLHIPGAAPAGPAPEPHPGSGNPPGPGPEPGGPAGPGGPPQPAPNNSQVVPPTGPGYDNSTGPPITPQLNEMGPGQTPPPGPTPGPGTPDTGGVTHFTPTHEPAPSNNGAYFTGHRRVAGFDDPFDAYLQTQDLTPEDLDHLPHSKQQDIWESFLQHGMGAAGRIARRRVADKTGPSMDLDSTYNPNQGKALKPKGDFKSYLDSVDQGAKGKVQRNFGQTWPGGEPHNMDPSDSGFAPNKEARKFIAWCYQRGLAPTLSTLDRVRIDDRRYLTIAAGLQRLAQGNEAFQENPNPGTPVTPPTTSDATATSAAPPVQPIQARRRQGDVTYNSPGAQLLQRATEGSPEVWNSDEGWHDPKPKKRPKRPAAEQWPDQQNVKNWNATAARTAKGVECPQCGKYLHDEVARMGHSHEGGQEYNASPQYGFESRGDYQKRTKGGRRTANDDIQRRLEEYRHKLRNENISWGELADLQGLADHIDPGDVELLEAAGVPEFPEHEASIKTRRRRTAAPNYLQKADEALTNLLNQKAEEFQTTIAPLQQALQTVQQATAMEQAANPLNVQPPAGTVSVLPAPQGGGGAGTDASQPGALALPGAGAGLGAPQPDATGSVDLSGAGGDTSAPPPAADAQGALPPELQQLTGNKWRQLVAMSMSRKHYVQIADALSKLPPEHRYTVAGPLAESFKADNPNFNHQKFFTAVGLDPWNPSVPPQPPQQLFGQRKRGGQGKGRARAAGQNRAAANVSQLWDRYTKSDVTLRGGAPDYEAFAQQYGVGPKALERLKAQHGVTARRRKQAWTGWGPQQKSLRNHKVAGWNWDHRLNGFITTAADKFACDCGEEHETPDYHKCKCGKVWNSYVIGTGDGEGRQAALEKVICREVLPGVGIVVANKRGMRKEAPFAGYKDWQACIDANRDKDSPEKYCGYIKHKVEGRRVASLGETLSVRDLRKARIELTGGYADEHPEKFPYQKLAPGEDPFANRPKFPHQHPSKEHLDPGVSDDELEDILWGKGHRGVANRYRYAEDEDFPTDDFPSDHIPDTPKMKSTPSDWHHRDKNQRWTK